ncbi:MAG: hypothetical protein JRI80_16860 [Deltaproteobacteria bacterium]|nr:hypothetical protein [Deltaproteobacteria bacterium]
MAMTVGQLKAELNPYPDSCPVEFMPIILPDGKHYRLHLARINDRGVTHNRAIGNGSVCYFEWDWISEDDEMEL